MELSDTNQDLLRKLAEVAPGTFQHSLQVANLAESAIHKIGGNPLLVRAGALYHDIGKMDNPYYFIENQSPDFNPHESLDFEESAEIIISHVTDGVKVANRLSILFVRTTAQQRFSTSTGFSKISFLKLKSSSNRSAIQVQGLSQRKRQ